MEFRKAPVFLVLDLALCQTKLYNEYSGVKCCVQCVQWDMQLAPTIVFNYDTTRSNHLIQT